MKFSVVIPVKNGRDTIEECLDGLFAQKIDAELEVLAVDSGSTDGTLDLLRRYPVRVVRILPGDFSHGDTRNLGAAETDGDLIVLFVQDAVPVGDRWLSRLTRNLVDDEAVAGAFSRVIPRPGCGPLVERGVKGDLNFGTERIETCYEGPPEEWDRHTHRLKANFNDVASCLRRSAWERVPYQRTPFGEDIVWADSALRAGYKIVFDPESEVIHSHEYQPSSIYPRTHIDAWFNRAYFDRYCVEKLPHVFIQTWRHFRDDRAFLRTKELAAARRFKESAVSLAYHFMEFLGFYMGGRKAGHVPRMGPVEARPLTILMASSERTRADARAWRNVEEQAAGLAERGHEVVMLRGMRDLEDRKPDVVHCQDFQPTTERVAERSAQMGLPLVVTINDYWFRCPRGDLVRPDGSFCSLRRPPGSACRLCTERAHEFIFPASLIDRIMTGQRLKRARDVLEGAQFVLVPDAFTRIKLAEAGIVGYDVVHLSPMRTPGFLDGLKRALGPDLPSAEDEPDPGRIARQLEVKYRQAVGRKNFLRAMK